MEEIDRLLAAQGRVVARRQVLRAGWDDADVERQLRRREWARVHPGVYADHTGPLSDDARAWAAVLAHHPAALSHRSALAVHGLVPAPATIEVAVDRRRNVTARPGVVVHYRADLERVAALHLSPPRVRLEQAVLDVAADASELDAVALVADACRTRRTTAARLSAALAQRSRIRHRALLRSVLDDVRSGVHSVLEHRYLRDVERRHALPRGTRQVRSTSGPTAYRDVVCTGPGVVVELDGLAGHAATLDRWADQRRDAEAVLAGLVTVRLGWPQVIDACATARLVAGVLAARGWRGRPRRCSGACSAEDPRR